LLSDHESAISAFEKSLEIRSGNPQAHYGLGVALDRVGRVEAAADQFREVAKLEPENAEALNYLGYMLAEKGIHLDEAVQVLERAVELHPENGYYLDSLGWAHFRKGSFERARGYLERAVRFAREDSVIFEHLGDALEKVGEHAKAREAWQKAAELDPNAPGPRSRLAPE
jgi:Flp pilus assembly protein TadD